MAKKRCVQAFALGLALLVLWLLATGSVKAQSPREFVMFGSVTQEDRDGLPVEGAIVVCRLIIASGQEGTDGGVTGPDGKFQFSVIGNPDAIRVWISLPDNLEIIGNSIGYQVAQTCVSWNIETINCYIVPVHTDPNLGPLRFFVRYIIPPTPTSTPTSTYTPTITPTPTKTLTPTMTLTPSVTPTPSLTPTPTLTSEPTQTPTQTLVPSVTPVQMPTAIPKKPTPATQLECSQRHIEQGYELMALLRFIAAVVVGLVGLVAKMVYDVGRS